MADSTANSPVSHGVVVIHDITRMAVGLIATIEIEMLLLENRRYHGGMNVAVEFVASGLRAVWPVFTRRYPHRNTGVAISAMRFIDCVSTSPESGFEQDTEQRVVDLVVRVEQNRSCSFRFDIRT